MGEMKDEKTGELCYKEQLRSVARGHMSGIGHAHRECLMKNNRYLLLFCYRLFSTVPH